MIPRIANLTAPEQLYRRYLAALKETAFKGETEDSYSARLLCATDNSVYQMMPQAVVFPKDEADVSVAVALAAKPEFKGLIITARGGGTGTNGQSLNRGLVLDLSRFMRGIGKFDEGRREVTVQTGVIKDELNEYLRPHGLFFSPELSTSSRATIGGMLSNDAAGQGSLKYGRTSSHVKSLRAVLRDGSVVTFGSVNKEELKAKCALQTLEGEIYRKCAQVLKDNAAKVRKHFPELNRFMTGYDLYHAYDPATDTINLARLITGAEGTLAVVTEVTLDLTVLPAYRALLLVKYRDFDSALRHANVLIEAGALSVETVDSKVLNLAKKDPVWFTVKDYIKDDGSCVIDGLNIVEFAGADKEHEDKLLHSLYQACLDSAKSDKGGITGAELVTEAAGIAAVYGMRKKAVGLLGSAAGRKKLVAFTEDTVVPPKNLADYIKKFRELLDSLHVEYGMFGHVDTGLMHVRPALDLTEEEDRQKLLTISHGVVKLVKEFGGQMWGEHGRGYRSCFGPVFFGDLYETAREIKTIFDPENKFNPGKICVPHGVEGELVSLEGLMRGDLDKTIPFSVREAFQDALNCNGNGQCFSYQRSALMCPSYRYTRDRVRSPKGYSALMREWLRLMNERGYNAQTCESELYTAVPNPVTWVKRAWHTVFDKDDFNHEYFRQIQTCVSCKSCKTQCPAHVNSADMNSRFLFMYYSRYLRPSMDILTLNAEFFVPKMAQLPGLFNTLNGLELNKWLLKKLFAFVDLPAFSAVPLCTQLKQAGFELLSVKKAELLHPDVVIVCDPFTAAYEAEGLVSLGKVIRALGYSVGFLRPYVNGKLRVIRGDRRGFVRYAVKQAARLESLSAAGIELVGYDPALTICYQDEYQQILGERRGKFTVQLPEMFLQKAVHGEKFAAVKERVLSAVHEAASKDEALRGDFYLFCHCTEQALYPQAVQVWQQLLSVFELRLLPVKVACCGMAGLFGHLLKNQDETHKVYEQNWQGEIHKRPFERILVTGFSCRSQVTRMEGKRPLHPVQLLSVMLEKAGLV